jgi:hypothetical protein
MTEQEVKDFLMSRTYEDVQDENGIDLTLIDLSLSATERLRKLESFHAQFNRIRGDGVISPDLKLREILESLREQRVEFVIVGGVAASLTGSPILTEDLDVCCRMTEENMARFAAAIRPMKPKVRGDDRNLTPPMDPRVLAKFNMLIMRTIYGDFDLVPEVVGIGRYDEVLKNSFQQMVEGCLTDVLTLEALITTKKMLKRPKDQLALLHLEAVKKKRDADGPGLFD